LNKSSTRKLIGLPRTEARTDLAIKASRRIIYRLKNNSQFLIKTTASRKNPDPQVNAPAKARESPGRTSSCPRGTCDRRHEGFSGIDHAVRKPKYLSHFWRMTIIFATRRPLETSKIICCSIGYAGSIMDNSIVLFFFHQLLN